MVFSSPTNDKLSFLVPESHAKAKNIALRNMLGCLLWAACCITCNTFINSCWAELHYHDISCHPTTRAHNIFTVSISGYSYLTSRPAAGKQRQTREPPWSRLSPNLRPLYWPDEGWRNTAKYTGINVDAFVCVREASAGNTLYELLVLSQTCMNNPAGTFPEVVFCTL